jgi:hypothetical protein
MITMERIVMMMSRQGQGKAREGAPGACRKAGARWQPAGEGG